ncbi:MAG: hypothetical protein ACOZIN_15820, partial [Myxococcota bacterium]
RVYEWEGGAKLRLTRSAEEHQRLLAYSSFWIMNEIYRSSEKLPVLFGRADKDAIKNVVPDAELIVTKEPRKLID